MDDNAVDETPVMLSTVDNPYNPFVNFSDWYAYDTDKGYNTCAYLARITKSSDELSDLDQTIATNLAIEEIMKLNILGIYIKITKDFVPKVK